MLLSTMTTGYVIDNYLKGNLIVGFCGHEMQNLARYAGTIMLEADSFNCKDTALCKYHQG